ncbi:MAG: hypothetical protein RLZZ46_1107, partial [Bacteroidota bacterium]
PAMGGVAKGQIVREVDALGGYSGIVSDISAIQFRMLNRSKGPAMWSPRTQNDRAQFAEEWRMMLEATPNVHFIQDMAVGIITEGNRACGVVTSMGNRILSRSVILTSGTFLNGIIHIGEKQFGGGRTGEKAATGITEQLVSLGFRAGRMKTGTPPRLDGRSLDYSKMELQPGDEQPSKFSYTDTPFLKNQIPCHITYTNERVHEILQSGFEQSPMFSGRIQGLGPRYCPSIEDKIVRFADKERHQLFVEPEGKRTIEIYVNGFSTSLPEDVQYAALKEVPGFEHVRMFRPGYAIEYDFFPPTQLLHSLETKELENLYFAGQINGTTGYEEAACQGLIAGMNAHLKISGKEPFILGRSEAYIGVLIDDLVTKGTDEPYRMFTSRAEYRILLRQDNADLRLTPRSFELGFATEDRMRKVEQKQKNCEALSSLFRNESMDPAEINPVLDQAGSSPINQKVKLAGLLARPNLTLSDFERGSKILSEKLSVFSEEEKEQAEIQLKYEGYIEREKEMAAKQQRLENIRLHDDLDFRQLTSLSAEAREKLSDQRPVTLGQASRISGVSPADISVLLVYLGR